jgi:hypothetical protein
MTTVGANSGTYYAVTDQAGPSTFALQQNFTLGSSPLTVILTFSLFANDDSGTPTVNPGGLDHNAVPNQHARVDLVTASALAFDTGAGVLANFFLGADGGPAPNGYTQYSLDISSLVAGGGTFGLRFAETDNQGYFNLGIDDVSIQAAPEPATTALFASGLLAVLALARARRRS